MRSHSHDFKPTDDVVILSKSWRMKALHYQPIQICMNKISNVQGGGPLHGQFGHVKILFMSS